MFTSQLVMDVLDELEEKSATHFFFVTSGAAATLC